jgi:hypothetical protein
LAKKVAGLKGRSLGEENPWDFTSGIKLEYFFRLRNTFLQHPGIYAAVNLYLIVNQYVVFFVFTENNSSPRALELNQFYRWRRFTT